MHGLMQRKVNMQELIRGRGKYAAANAEGGEYAGAKTRKWIYAAANPGKRRNRANQGREVLY
jgi:hypothetical protein